MRRTLASLASLALVSLVVAAGCSATPDNPMDNPTVHLDQGAKNLDMTALSCSGGQVPCGSSCVDVKTDPNNCGMCGMLCQSGQSCQGGACVDATSCPKGQTSCSGACVDTAADAMNCGGCGMACAAGQACNSGKCGPPAMGGSAGCADTVKCINACAAGDTKCENACTALASAKGKGLLNAVFSCLDAACPAKNGGVCDDKAPGYDAMKCDQCYQDAQGMSGACGPQIAACLGDTTMGGNPDMTMGDNPDMTMGGGDDGPPPVDMKKGDMKGADMKGVDMKGADMKGVDMKGADMKPGPDGGAGTTCGATLDCVNACTSLACEQACSANASTQAKGLLSSLLSCLDAACPATGGAVCDDTSPNYDAAKCDLCYQTAQDPGGKCEKPLNACLNDGGMMSMCGAGQTSCGGTCVDVSKDAKNCGSCGKACLSGQTCTAGKCVSTSKMTGCNGAVNCLNGCKSGDSTCASGCIQNTTTQGKQILQALFTCLENACPSTNGGVCDSGSFFYSATKCNSCYTKAQATSGKCHSKLTACQGSKP